MEVEIADVLDAFRQEHLDLLNKLTIAKAQIAQLERALAEQEGDDGESVVTLLS